MTFLEALAQTNGYRAVARPKGSTMREGLGWRIDGVAVHWYDPTAIVDFRQYTATPWPTARQLLDEWEVVNL